MGVEGVLERKTEVTPTHAPSSSLYAMPVPVEPTCDMVYQHDGGPKMLLLGTQAESGGFQGVHLEPWREQGCLGQHPWRLLHT